MKPLTVTEAQGLRERAGFKPRHYGTAREEALALALSAVLDACGRVLVTIPRNTLAHAIVEGALERPIEIAAKVLEGKP